MAVPVLFLLITTTNTKQKKSILKKAKKAKGEFSSTDALLIQGNPFNVTDFLTAISEPLKRLLENV